MITLALCFVALCTGIGIGLCMARNAPLMPPDYDADTPPPPAPSH
jgi:hypothetical protein